jgi:hypothetical protein
MKHVISLSRRSALGLSATLLAPRMVFAASKRPVLIELFTSQGCSSCPPADKLAAELAADDHNIVVSFNVDYWDYLGWRDTLAKPDYTQRQYDYAKSRGDGSVYTPQMVINGAEHLVGSHRNEVTAKVRAQQAAVMPIDISLSLSTKDITVRIPEGQAREESTLWLMAVEPRVQQKIERGENAGESITYVNVVRNLVPAAMWKGKAYEGSWMRSAVMPKGCTSLIAVLQQENVGPVLGLARA